MPQPLLINRASADERFRKHPGLLRYGIESYIAVPLIRRDGSYFGTLCTLDPQPTALDEDAFEIFQLLAQLIAFELEADEQQQGQERELRRLEDVIAIAAHDIRQPLTVLSGRAQMLERKARRGAAATDLARDAGTIVAQARRAVELSDELLDVARAEARALTAERGEVDLTNLARTTIEHVAAGAPQHTFVLEGSTDVLVHGDRSRLGRVIVNLLDNAAKYAPATNGPIVVRVERNGASAQLTVRDRGAGVGEDELPHIFDRNYRTAEAKAGATGDGLGLYIARQIVEAHGGAIWAERVPEGGFAIHLSLPVE